MAGSGSKAWEDQANVFDAPVLSLSTLPVVRVPPVPFEPAAKVPAIAAFTGDRPAAWVDDAHTSEARDWARSRSAPMLLITADPSRGLTPDMVEELVKWRASL
ncbi:hypothetical protein [Kitasatospora mediocidica]|uniref:hypothetical protein n=1 Tax=Kitasatospora mediocidica TaxID=58352 RepID=UPI001E2F4034|nr:hypothetical protein [Kitasatospora mediocidica]